MECKRKSLFILIALSILIGFIPYTYSTESESVYVCEFNLDQEDTTVTKYLITSDINEGDALRHFSKTKRVNSSSSSKLGLTFIKRNAIPYTSSIIFESNQRFHSGLGEGRKRLISFGVLII